MRTDRQTKPTAADKQLNCAKINRKSENEIEKDKRRDSERNSGARETEAEEESRKQV